MTGQGKEAPLGYSWKQSQDETGHPIWELQRGPYAQKIGETFREIVLVLARMGHHLIIDDISFGKKQLDPWKKALRECQVLWVGVNAPLDVLEQREKQRGNRIVGSARGQFRKVHAGANYDLEIDTHHVTVAQNVERIRSCMAHRARSPISIRPLQRADIPKIVDRFSFSWSTPDKTQVLWDRYAVEQEYGMRTVAVIEKDHNILGYGSLLRKGENPQFLSRNIPEINNLWIDEGHRRQGLGTTLIRWLEELAIEEGFREIGIGVGLYPDYGSAQKLYCELGYVPDGRGATYQGQAVVPGQAYPLNDELILWFVKVLKD
jgi:GNAT superfamily N-acetyltransferase